MKYRIDNQKIFNAIEEMGEEYKDMLIAKVLSDDKLDDVDQLNLPELLRYDLKLKEILSTDSRRERVNRLIPIVQTLSMLCVLGGLMFLFLRQITQLYNDSIEMQLAFAYTFIGIIGFSLSLIMRVFPYTIFKKRYNNQSNNIEIINQWKKLEAQLIQQSPIDIDTSLEGMVKHLTSIRVLDEKDAVTIRKLLNLRNQAVHSDKTTKKYKYSELVSLLRESEEIVRKLERFEGK